MKQKDILEQCPICNSSAIQNEINVIDHMITKEEFTIQKCTDCGFYFTNPRPSEETNSFYYQSDEYISHSSSKKGIINKLYNVVRNYTLKQKRNIIEKLTPERNLLDIGCGTGHFLNECKENGWNVTGLEPDSDARNFTRENFNFETEPIQNLYSKEEKSFNVITMWHVLEHVYHLQKDVKQIVSLLKKDGYLVIAVPNRKSLDANLYKTYWAAYDVPRHLYHFSENDVKNLISQKGLQHIKTLPMKFDSFYISMLSEKYKNGSILKAFLNGCKSNLKAKKGFGYSSQIYVFKKIA